MPVPFSGRRKPTPRFVRIASMQDSDVTPPYVLLLPTDMNGEPTTNWTTTTWVKEEVPVPPLFSFPISPSSDLFLLLPRMPRAANQSSPPATGALLLPVGNTSDVEGSEGALSNPERHTFDLPVIGGIGSLLPRHVSVSLSSSAAAADGLTQRPTFQSHIELNYG
ncbi:hypothetical protein V8E52_006327 [Russula decolorans]